MYGRITADVYYEDIANLCNEVRNLFDATTLYVFPNVDSMYYQPTSDPVQDIFDAGALCFNYPSLAALKGFIDALLRAGCAEFGYSLLINYILLCFHQLNQLGDRNILHYERILSEGFFVEHHMWLVNSSSTAEQYYARSYGVSGFFPRTVPFRFLHEQCECANQFVFANGKLEPFMNKFCYGESDISNKVQVCALLDLQLHERDILASVPVATAQRGVNYVLEKRIGFAVANIGSLAGSVRGSQNQYYSVSIKFDTLGHITEHQCDCMAHKEKPYTPCKHVIALAIYHNRLLEKAFSKKRNWEDV